jgi:hypothetical protein
MVNSPGGFLRLAWGHKQPACQRFEQAVDELLSWMMAGVFATQRGLDTNEAGHP